MKKGGAGEKGKIQRGKARTRKRVYGHLYSWVLICIGTSIFRQDTGMSHEGKREMARDRNRVKERDREECRIEKE